MWGCWEKQGLDAFLKKRICSNVSKNADDAYSLASNFKYYKSQHCSNANQVIQENKNK